MISQLNYSLKFDYLQMTLLCIWLWLTKPMLPSYKKISNFLKNGKIDQRCLSTWTSVMCYKLQGAGTPSPTYDYILHNRILKEKDAVKYLGITVHHKLSWNKHICSIVKKVNSSIGFFRRNLQIYQKHIQANDCKSSMHLLYGILSPKRTKIKLRWYREELPALFATTTDAKQVSLPYLMSLAGAVSGSEEQTKD